MILHTYLFCGLCPLCVTAKGKEEAHRKWKRQKRRAVRPQFHLTSRRLVKLTTMTTEQQCLCARTRLPRKTSESEAPGGRRCVRTCAHDLLFRAMHKLLWGDLLDVHNLLLNLTNVFLRNGRVDLCSFLELEIGHVHDLLLRALCACLRFQTRSEARPRTSSTILSTVTHSHFRPKLLYPPHLSPNFGFISCHGKHHLSLIFDEF